MNEERKEREKWAYKVRNVWKQEEKKVINEGMKERKYWMNGTRKCDKWKKKSNECKEEGNRGMN